MRTGTVGMRQHLASTHWGCHPSKALWWQWHAPTFAVLPVTGVARFAGALVGLGSVLADGINVAVVSALHTLINICKTGEGSNGESLGWE